MSRFLHDCGPGQCKFVLFYAPCRLSPKGPVHGLAMACGAPVTRVGSSWCDVHVQGLFDATRVPLKIPDEPRRTVAAPRAERTRDLCEELSA